MGKLIAAFCLFSLFSSALSAGAVENVIYGNIATCQAKIDGVSFRLDFFEGFRSEDNNDVSTGKGFVVQTMGGENGMKMLSQVDIENEATVKKIKMYAVLEPQTLFAGFEMPRNQKQFRLEITALNFGAKWSTFDCQAKQME